MSHETEHGGAAAAPSPFTAEQIAAFHREDRGTAVAIIVLMLAIFTLGLVGYTAIAIWVS